jgi:hypothetical protein
MNFTYPCIAVSMPVYQKINIDSMEIHKSLEIKLMHGLPSIKRACLKLLARLLA